MQQSSHISKNHFLKKNILKITLCSTIISSSALLSGCIAPLLLVAGGAATVTANTVGSNVPVKTQWSDSKIKMKATEFINKMPSLKDNSNVGITVYNRVVLLTGQVPTLEDKNTIATKISELNGVRRVYDELTVGHISDFKQYAKSSWITTKVKTAIAHAGVNPFNFKVVTVNSVVYLLAITDKENGQLAASAASRVSGVSKVVKAYFYQNTSNQIDTAPAQNP